MITIPPLNVIRKFAKIPSHGWDQRFRIEFTLPTRYEKHVLHRFSEHHVVYQLVQYIFLSTRGRPRGYNPTSESKAIDVTSKLSVSSAHRKSAYNNRSYIAHPYTLFTSRYMRYVDDRDESYDNMYLLLARVYLYEL